MKKNKVLVINSKTLLPNIDGATIRSTQMVRMLSEQYDIDLLYTCSKSTKPKDTSPLLKYCQQVIGFSTSSISMVINGLLGFFRNKPLECSYFYSREAQKYIDKHLDEYDFVFCNNVRAAQYVVGKSCHKVIDYVDALSMRYSNEMKKANWIWKAICKIEIKRLKKYETRILKEFDGHIIISNIDKQHILEHAKIQDPPEIFVVNNSTELYDCIQQPDTNNIVFVGSMFYQPNVQATTSFVHKVLPSILKSKPEVKFYIVGSRPTKQVQRLASDHVIVTGFVDDPKEYLKNAAVVVVPMVSGAGVQNKILEAMSMGCCVVTTVIGAEGLTNIIDKHDFFIAKDNQQIADYVLQLLNDKQLRNTIGANAHEYIAKTLTYEIINQHFHECLNQLSLKK